MTTRRPLSSVARVTSLLVEVCALERPVKPLSSKEPTKNAIRYGMLKQLPAYGTRSLGEITDGVCDLARVNPFWEARHTPARFVRALASTAPVAPDCSASLRRGSLRSYRPRSLLVRFERR